MCNFLLIIIIILITIQSSTQSSANKPCSPYRFLCANKEQCIDGDFECDGKYDCDDHSDEKLCENKKPEECLPPRSKNGFYEILTDNTTRKYNSRKPIPQFSILSFFCLNPDFKLSTPHSTIHCLKGKFPLEIPDCIDAYTCPTSVFHYSLDVSFEFNNKNIDSTKINVLPNTSAKTPCKPNFTDPDPWNYHLNICLPNGTWFGKMKKCISIYKCPAIPSTEINVYCELNGVVQDCSKEVTDGTYSRMTCKPNYVDDIDGPTVSTCMNGTWTKPIKKCIPDCNRIVHEGQTNIVNGSSASRGDFPWHVAIYRQKPEVPLTYICGGSLISVKIVLSAAHCFTNLNNGKINPSSEYSVAAGKTYNSWDAVDDEYYVQKRNITNIHTPRNIYFGQLTSHAGDIAVIVVDKAFTPTNFISPVCVDWDLKVTDQQLNDGTLGKLAGWGSTTTGNPRASVNLKQLRMPYVNRDDCVKIVPYNFISFVTADKFCAGYTNGSSICNGDSGGGLVFPFYNKDRIKKYYLQGIVSIGPTKDGACDDFQLGVYTKVSNYISFIKGIEESNRM